MIFFCRYLLLRLKLGSSASRHRYTLERGKCSCLRLVTLANKNDIISRNLLLQNEKKSQFDHSVFVCNTPHLPLRSLRREGGNTGERGVMQHTRLFMMVPLISTSAVSAPSVSSICPNERRGYIRSNRLPLRIQMQESFSKKGMSDG